MSPLVHAQQASSDSVTLVTDTNMPAANPPAMATDSQKQGGPQAGSLLQDALTLLQQKQFDAALVKVNAAIQISPKNIDGYGLRGGIYAESKQWDKAAKDYQIILQLDPTNAQAKFNIAELDFMQKHYDAARPGFISLEQDRNLGDLATYKVFLCDLLAGHDDIASKELAAMDQAAAGASFYFAKAAWALYHKNNDDARSWLTSAAGIYSPAKFKLYSASLFDLGYLPLPPPAAH